MTASSQYDDANTKGGLLQNEILEPLFNDDDEEITSTTLFDTVIKPWTTLKARAH